MIKYEELIKIWYNQCNNSNNPVLLYDLYNAVKKLKNKYSKLIECDNDVYLIRFNQLNKLMKDTSARYDFIMKREQEKLKGSYNRLNENKIKCHKDVSKYNSYSAMKLSCLEEN